VKASGGDDERSGRRVAAVLLGTLLFAACVRVERPLPGGGTQRVPRSEIAAYAQEVFKHRNAVSTQFLERSAVLADADSLAARRLEEAEDAMDAACAPVDALAIAYRDGESVGFGKKLELARALEGCATATAAAETALASGH
jgi:hypothetical protein